MLCVLQVENNMAMAFLLTIHIAGLRILELDSVLLCSAWLAATVTLHSRTQFRTAANSKAIYSSTP
jgi:hypothetical protein